MFFKKEPRSPSSVSSDPSSGKGRRESASMMEDFFYDQKPVIGIDNGHPVFCNGTVFPGMHQFPHIKEEMECEYPNIPCTQSQSGMGVPSNPIPCSSSGNVNATMRSYSMSVHQYVDANNNSNTSLQRMSSSSSSSSCGSDMMGSPDSMSGCGVTIKQEPLDNLPSPCNMQCNRPPNCSMPMGMPLTPTDMCPLVVDTKPVMHSPTVHHHHHHQQQSQGAISNSFTFNINIPSVDHHIPHHPHHHHHHHQPYHPSFNGFPPTPPNSHPGSPADIPLGMEGSALSLRPPPPPYPMAVASKCGRLTPITNMNLSAHAKYNRKNNPDLERRRIHHCNYPGEPLIKKSFTIHLI